MKQKRRVFDQAFKLAAVKLIVEQNFPVSEVSKRLSVPPNSLNRWVNEYEEHGEQAFPGRGTVLFSTQLEIRKLKRENQSLREELDLLLAGIAQRFTVVLADKIDQHQYIKSLKPLIA